MGGKGRNKNGKMLKLSDEYMRVHYTDLSTLCVEKFHSIFLNTRGFIPLFGSIIHPWTTGDWIAGSTYTDLLPYSSVNVFFLGFS